MVDKEMIFFKENKRDKSKTDLEINLLKKIDIQALFDKVVVLPLKFKYPQISLEEKIVKFTQGPVDIIVSEEGRIWISNSKSQEDAMFILNEIEVML